MSNARNSWMPRLGLCAAIAAGFLVTGCKGLYYSDPNPDQPYVFPDQAANPPTAVSAPPVLPAVANVAPTNVTGATSPLRRGELITVIFSDVPPPGLQELKVRIGEDGKITLYYNVTVVAADRTPSQLQEEIRKEYINRKLFNVLTVTVKTEERFYSVGGEVRYPNRMIYMGYTTVFRAIDSAQGFGDFANRSRIELRRANGQTFMIDWKKAVKDPRLDLEVFPGDQIIVHRRHY